MTVISAPVRDLRNVTAAPKRGLHIRLAGFGAAVALVGYGLAASPAAEHILGMIHR